MSKTNNNKSIVVLGGAVAILAGFLLATNPNTETSNTATNNEQNTQQVAEDRQKDTSATTEKASDQPKQDEQATKTDQSSAKEAQPADVSDERYVYTAQPGDSYTTMARKAIQTYGARTNTTLTHAQIVAAETFLTQAARSPELLVGQKVTFKTDVVKMHVDKARKLDSATIAAWQMYVPYVDFETNHVGER